MKKTKPYVPPAGIDLGEPLEFMRLLWAVDHALQSRSKKMAATLGVTSVQRIAIRIIGKKPGISAKELSETLCLDPSTLTGVLSRLEKAKLILRKSDPTDARKAVLTLTPAGKKIDAAKTGTIEATVRRLFASIPSIKIGAAKEVLEALGVALESD
ncbi:MAG: MarR family transcriptional regulator [Bdellovibrionota bacterium]